MNLIVKDLIDKMNAILIEAEKVRLSAVRKLNILDSPTEPVFDSIAKLASEVCDMPIALISILDENRQWFKANIGLPEIKETDRASAFCSYTILSDELLMVPDTIEDERFIHNILVTKSPKIRFYAGAPIRMPSGQNIGSLCVIDVKPNYLNHSQRNTLIGLAKLISDLLVTRNEHPNISN